MLKTFTKYKSDRKIVKINHKIRLKFNIYRLFGQNATKTDPAIKHQVGLLFVLMLKKIFAGDLI